MLLLGCGGTIARSAALNPARGLRGAPGAQAGRVWFAGPGSPRAAGAAPGRALGLSPALPLLLRPQGAGAVLVPGERRRNLLVQTLDRGWNRPGIAVPTLGAPNGAAPGAPCRGYRLHPAGVQSPRSPQRRAALAPPSPGPHTRGAPCGTSGAGAPWAGGATRPGWARFHSGCFSNTCP
ncbi:hypothetical protein Nmel_011091, partial [Mimus melanotis]